jgi:hypothetical protein
MPAGSSSRRRASERNRDPSSDRIEEDQPNERLSDEEEDEEQPRRRVKKKDNRAAISKVASGQAHSVGEEEDGQRDSGDEDRIDVNDLKDQPLIRAHASKISGIASDWSNFRKMAHAPSFTLIRDIARNMAEVDDDGKVIGNL